MKKYAAYVSGKATRVQKAIIKYRELKEAIECVVTDEGENLELKTFFENNGIEYYALNFKKLDKNSDRNLVFSDYLLSKLKLHNINYCFLFGGHILKGLLLEEYSYRLINFHPGIIPEVTGLHAIDKALQSNKRYIGNTVHFINDEVDAGPIIMQNVMLADNFSVSGYDGFLDQQILLLYETFKLLEADRIMISGSKAIIKDADYTTSYIFPSFK